MQDEKLLKLFNQITIWKAGHKRAPHKPLLLLLMLARVKRGETRLIPYIEVEQILPELIDAFGPPRKSKAKAQDPFWRLIKDGIWDIPIADKIREDKSGTPFLSDLKSFKASGGFKSEIYNQLIQDTKLLDRVAQDILNIHFPETYHPDILNAIAMPEHTVSNKPKRKSSFRREILRVYNYRCAICGYDGRLGHSLVGIEAAHFKWHAAGGPDTIENGTALCTFHHKIFDRGAITLTDDHIIDASQEVNGTTQVNNLILQYVGKQMHFPQFGQHKPAKQYLAWHRKNVFKTPGRLFG